MNKFITIAALLAAGTAFSNATTVVSWNDLLSCEATFFDSTQTTVGNTLTLSASERVQFDVSSLGIDLATDQYVFTLDVSNLQVGNGPMIAWGTETGQTTAAQIYGFGGSGNSNCWAATINGANMSQRYSSSMSYTATGLDGSQSLSGTFTLTLGDGKLSVVFVDSSDSSSYTLTPSGGLDMGGFASGTSIKALTLGGWASTSGNGSTMTVSTIPEPSAFGLLAGVGALALVASRRRRTK